MQIDRNACKPTGPSIPPPIIHAHEKKSGTFAFPFASVAGKRLLPRFLLKFPRSMAKSAGICNIILSRQCNHASLMAWNTTVYRHDLFFYLFTETFPRDTYFFGTITLRMSSITSMMKIGKRSPRLKQLQILGWIKQYISNNINLILLLYLALVKK